MVGEDMFQGTENVDSEIAVVVEIAECVGAEVVVEVAECVGVGTEVVVEIAECVGVGAETVAVVGGEAENADDVEADAVNVAGADTAMVGVHYEVAFVEEGYTEYADSEIVNEAVVAMLEGIVVGAVIVIAVTGAETVTVGFVDDAKLVQIQKVYANVDVRVGLRVGIEIEVGVGPMGQRNCRMANFQDMFGEHKNNLLFRFRMEQVSDACLG